MVTFQIILLVVLGVGAAVLAFFVIKSFVAPKRIDNVQKLLKQGKNTTAIKLAKSIITKDNRDYKAHYFLGKAYLADNKPELALMEFKIVNQNAIFDAMGIPEIEFRNLSSQLYAKFNQIDEALKEYLLLTNLDPQKAEYFYNAGALFEKKSKTDQALLYYQKTIELSPRHVQARAARGMLLYRAKQFGDAKKEIDYAIKLSPETFSSYYYLGKILKEAKDYAGAIGAFEKSLRAPEFRQRSFIERGSCYMAANNIEKAIDELDRAIKSAQNEGSQETLYARYFLASCYEHQRKIDLALPQWEKIYEQNKAFKDVSAKLIEYRDLQGNDSMKEYLTSSADAFIELCKQIASKGMGYSLKDIKSTKFGCKLIASEAKGDNWMNVRPQLYLILFYRETELIEDGLLRSLVEEVKKQNCVKGIICTSSGFTGASVTFAENRPIELIGKDKLQQLLSKAGI